MPDKGAGPLPFLPPFKGLGERPRQGRGLAPSLVGKYLGWGHYEEQTRLGLRRGRALGPFARIHSFPIPD